MLAHPLIIFRAYAAQFSSELISSTKIHPLKIITILKESSNPYSKQFTTKA